MRYGGPLSVLDGREEALEGAGGLAGGFGVAGGEARVLGRGLRDDGEVGGADGLGEVEVQEREAGRGDGLDDGDGVLDVRACEELGEFAGGEGVSGAEGADGEGGGEVVEEEVPVGGEG